MNPIVSVEWLSDHINDPDLVILDASMPSKLAKTQPISTTHRIPGARFFDLKNTFRDKNNVLPNTHPNPLVFTKACQALGINKNSRIIIYDTLGIYTSPRARWLFLLMGHQEVSVLDGGLPAWMKNDQPVEEIKNDSYSKGNFEANFQANLVKDAPYVMDHLDDPNVLVLDARGAGRFNGTTPEPRAGMKGGHMPNAKNLPYTNVLEDGHFKSKEDLKSIFDELEIGNAALTFSCGSGITACVVMLASELAVDNPKAVYDGSWSEWGQAQESYPVIKTED